MAIGKIAYGGAAWGGGFCHFLGNDFIVSRCGNCLRYISPRFEMSTRTALAHNEAIALKFGYKQWQFGSFCGLPYGEGGWAPFLLATPTRSARLEFFSSPHG